MKICFFSEARSIHTQRWASSLGKSGCDVHLISSSLSEIANVKLHHRPIYSRNPIQQVINNIRIRYLIKELDPDITHLFGLFSFFSIGTMFLAKDLKNLIISVWGSDIVPSGGSESYKKKMIKQYLINKGNTIVAISKYLAVETQKYLNSPKRIEIVPWGVDLEKFNPVHRKDSSKMVKLGFAKKLHELSAPDILLKAFKYASDRCNKRLFLKIAGDGPMAEKLKQDAKEMEIDKNIEWLGWLNNSNDLGKFFNSIDIFLMPSRRESFGVSAVEASASGLPVIASNFGGIPEIVQDGKSGFLVNPDDAEGLGKAIIIVAKDKELRARMGYEGRKFVANKYDWNSNVEQMIEIYKQVKSI